jgi:hypothetical protein
MPIKKPRRRQGFELERFWESVLVSTPEERSHSSHAGTLTAWFGEDEVGSACLATVPTHGGGGGAAQSLKGITGSRIGPRATRVLALARVGPGRLGGATGGRRATGLPPARARSSGRGLALAK